MKGILILTMAAGLAACGHVSQSNEYVVTSNKSCCTTTTKYVTKTCCPTVVQKPVVNRCCNAPTQVTSGCCGSGYYNNSYYEPAVYADTYVGYSDYDYYY